MRRTLEGLLVVAIVVVAGIAVIGRLNGGAPAPSRPAVAAAAEKSRLSGVTPHAQPVVRLEDAFIEFPLSPADQKYAAIDGKHMHQDVDHLSSIGRRYRDQGHPQFWGRIIGTSADAE